MSRAYSKSGQKRNLATDFAQINSDDWQTRQIFTLFICILSRVHLYKSVAKYYPRTLNKPYVFCAFLPLSRSRNDINFSVLPFRPSSFATFHFSERFCPLFVLALPSAKDFSLELAKSAS